jgi:hypothetical protein
MPGKRNARSRVRGSWAARLTGAGFAILLAAVGAAVYLLVGGAHADNDSSNLPTRVLATQAIGLAYSPSASDVDALEAAPGGLGFGGSQSTGANWTSDQMAGGTYIFIYLQNGRCLGPSRAASVSLQRSRRASAGSGSTRCRAATAWSTGSCGTCPTGGA